ncbi:O-antigen ligase family protein [Neisseria sp. CCUG12390]|uniref:O-antigen ligase family protein n=1 Tax=Neisseria sp. CCUG12390 TaxID=3392035 RepID=UPI003A0FDD42
MKIKALKIYTALFYLMIFSYMLGPALSYRVGIPRIDNPLTVFIVLATAVIAVFEAKRIPRNVFYTLSAVFVMAYWGGIHLWISTLSRIQFMDTLFFLSLPSLFYLLYLIISRHEEPLVFIRRTLIFFVACMVIPPVIEVATGFQFVQSNEVLAVDSGIIKGFFFNPNNLGTAALCFAPAVLLFFNVDARPKDKIIGWLLFLSLGAVIFASASRTATLCYIILFLLNLIYRNNAVITALMLLISGIVLSLIPKEWIGNFLLSLNENVFLENISSRLYLFLFDLESDNSVGYRQEIYNYFWNNPPLLLYGYGPKNFREYFAGHLSGSLGFENPHSFIIELYLGFGIISLLAFAAYVLYYMLQTVASGGLRSKQKFIAWLAMGLFLLAGFIPSTIFRMPFIWFPCFMIFIYSTLPLFSKKYAAA